jgi:two-component system response regulator AtoC
VRQAKRPQDGLSARVRCQEFLAMISSLKHSSQPTVLLVEDDELVRDAMCKALVRAGYLVQTAATGHDAVAILRTPLSPSGIDVVLLDIQLPDVSGIDLCARFRELQPNLPVVVCTGCTDPEENAELIKLGIRGYFAKPIPMEELLATMEEVVA